MLKTTLFTVLTQKLINMKKILFIAVLLLATTLNAQTNFSWGPKIGYKASFITIEDHFVLKPKDNVTFGVFGRIMIKDFIIQPELMYSYSVLDSYSVKFDPRALVYTLYEYDVKLKNNSLALPIYFGYQFVKRDNYKMRVNAGPILHFNFDKCEYNNCANPLPGFSPNDLSRWDYKFINIGAALSLGADIHRFVVDLSFTCGLTGAFVDGIELNSMINIGSSAVVYSDRYNTLLFTLGYRF